MGISRALARFLNKLLPQDSGHSLNTAPKIVANFIEHFHPESIFNILFGSYLRNEQFPDSDIDLIVVYEKEVEPRHEKVGYESQSFDCYVFDVESLHGILHRATKTGKFALVNAVIDGRVLPVDNAVADQIKSVANAIRTRGFKYTKTESARFHVSELCKSLSRNPIGPEKTILSVDMYKAICSILLNSAGEGICTGKQASRVLQRSYPELFLRLNEALRHALCETPERLIQVANDALSLIGGKLDDGYRLNFDNLARIPLNAA